jgi:hypothetical protein
MLSRGLISMAPTPSSLVRKRERERERERDKKREIKREGEIHR